MTIRQIDWQSVQLVVFDVDGTLYCQRRLRLRMAFELSAHALRSRDLRTIRVLSRYRALREEVAEREVVDFAPALIAETAAACRVPTSDVAAIVAEWIEQRPLRHLAGCRYPGVAELFAALRRAGKAIGVLSDYPAVAKLQALGLAADHVVCAEDRDVGVLKPNPAGLLTLVRTAGWTTATTMLIGDRPDRDGLAARRAGVRVLIRSSRQLTDWPTFRRFDEPLFAPILANR
ncbi:MAG: HAD family hydrolase [Reyranella sp.]|jgi:FMN phosphatase YigB (HAD superfamily)|nr:MAG: HAD family hydrolase [Reyranella sp.]